MKNIIFAILITLFVSTQAHAWVINDDFESGTVGQRANTKYGSSLETTSYSSEQHHSGTKSAKATVAAGSSGACCFGMRYNISDLGEGSEIWFRVWFYVPSNFIYSEQNGSGLKGLRVRVYQTSDPTSFSQFINIYPHSNDLKVENWVDLKLFTSLYDTAHKVFQPGLAKGSWTAVEMYIKFSSKQGQGIFRAYRNGVMFFEDTQVNTLFSGGQSLAMDTEVLTFYSNTPSPVKQSIYLDDIYITNERPNNTDSNGNPYIGVGDVGNVKAVANPNPPIPR